VNTVRGIHGNHPSREVPPPIRATATYSTRTSVNHTLNPFCPSRISERVTPPTV
jgi:hypothetical protein